MASVPKLLVLFFLSYHSAIAIHAGDEGSYRVLLSIGSSLRTNKSVCSEFKAVRSSSGAATVPLHHRHGPCSPLPTKKKMPTLEKMLHHDQLRAAYIQRKFSGVVKGGYNFQKLDATANVPTTLDDANQYVITVRLGSPAKSQTMVIDTGSDVSWVQCQPCLQCHYQVDPLFDPRSSTTYSPFSCSSAACAQLGQYGNGCSSSQCQYIVTYGDGSTTTGTYSSDTLALGSNVVVRNFQFGCSHYVEGLVMNSVATGLMGLGGGSQSLVSQTAGTFGTAFSYCLPPTPSSAGFLTLGAGTTLGFVRTPMLRSQYDPTSYAVRLEAIRVGGSQLNIPSWVFSSGSIVDSGTTITRLPLMAYSALSLAFKARMRQYSPAPPNSILDTCFDFSGQSSVSIPTVALVFSGGAVVDLAADGIMVDMEPSGSIWCLAFMANSDNGSPGFIGNVQQRTFEVLYDVGGGAVGFKAGAC